MESLSDTVKVEECKLEPPSEEVFLCRMCDYAFYSAASYEEHRSSHKQPFKERNAIRLPDKPSFGCNVCGYKTVYKTNLLPHLSTHTGEKLFSCGLCDTQTVRKGDLKRHIMHVHLRKTPHKCETCGYATAHKGHLFRHMATHTGRRPFVCSICGFQSTQKSNLTRHVNTHFVNRIKHEHTESQTHQFETEWHFPKSSTTSTAKFYCYLCSHASSTKDNLRRHLSRHRQLPAKVKCELGERFACDSCNFKARYKATLKSHVYYAHANQTVFGCGVCCYKTARKGHLNRHMALHGGR